MDLSKIISDSIVSIQPEGISTFNQQIKDIPNLIPLTVGEPDLDTPEHVKAAAIKAIQDNDSHYTTPAGGLAVRKAAADFVADKYDIHYDPETEVVTTIGVSEAILNTFLALLNPGDEVLIPSPAFPVYAGAVQVAGGQVNFINTADDNFKLTPEKLTQVLNEHPSAKAVLLTCPNNPTGRSYSNNELKALADVIRKHDLIVISDEIYSELTYHGTHQSFAKFLPEQTIVFNGLSKSHAMTGWRFGVIFAPKILMNQLAKVHLFNTYNVSAIVQAAALEAFTVGKDDALPMKQTYAERQKLVLDGLRKVGIDVDTPEGAFYVFAKVPSNYPGNSVEFCLDVARHAHVGMVPGSGFGPGGEGYFRISYAASTADLTEAINRIQKFVAKLPTKDPIA
ncbi:aminotransferase class I/II-fold pyridoxal phosphate-dependent enzyme [Lactobacillaceae bacterium Scapto_B20]